MKIKARKGARNIKLLILSFRSVSCNALSQKKKVIPVSKRPTYIRANIPFVSGKFQFRKKQNGNKGIKKSENKVPK